MKTPPALFALALGAFGIGMTEFTPMGLLPQIAASLDVSIPRAGMLVSAYALGVMIGAPVMTLGTGRVARRTLLIGLALLFTLGNGLAALSHSYGLLLAARVITSFNHGAFFGVGAVVAASLVPAERSAGAVATMFMGLTLATVAGVPLATWIGERFGWHATFGVIAALGMAIVAALALTLPRQPAPAHGSARAELRVLMRGEVLAALGLTVLGSTAMFTVFTYIVPILQRGSHASFGFVAAMLSLWGVGLSVGNWIGGRYADRSVNGTLIATLTGLALVLVAFAVLLPHEQAVAVLVFLWGVASFALVPPLQMQVMRAAADAPNLASSVNIGAFNLGNALGAALGGAMLSAGFNYGAIPLAGAVTSLLGLVWVLLGARRRVAVS